MKVSGIKKYLKVYGILVRGAVLKDLEYRADFVVRIISEMIWGVVFIAFLEVVFSRVDSIVGWSREEVIFVFAISRFNYKLLDTFVSMNLRNLPILINRGQLDMAISKPISTLFLISSDKVEVVKLLGNVVNVILMLYVLPDLALDLSAVALLQVAFYTVLLWVSYYFLLLAIFSLAFWFGDINHGFWIIGELRDSSRMPLQAFSGGWKIFFNDIFPVVLFGPVQAAILLGRFESFNGWVYVISASIWMLAGFTVWNRGLRSYTSAGG